MLQGLRAHIVGARCLAARPIRSATASVGRWPSVGLAGGAAQLAPQAVSSALPLPGPGNAPSATRPAAAESDILADEIIPGQATFSPGIRGSYWQGGLEPIAYADALSAEFAVGGLR